MPQVGGTTILGSQIITGIPAQNLQFVALYFTFPPILALVTRSVGRLKFQVINSSQLITVKDWSAEYPGIYPLYSQTTPFPAGFFVLDCFRPGLPYTLFYQ